MLITENNRKWWVFFATSLVLVMTNIDYTAVNLALAPIANDLHTNLSTLQWIINGYSSAAAACAVIGGRLGDVYGYRKIFVAGVIIFTVTSVLIGLAFDKWSIIILRIIQGAGGAICWPLCVVIISNVFPKDQQGYAIGRSMAIAAIALAVGPTFGGILLHYLSWRWIFFINFPLGILAIFLASFLIPKLQQTTRSLLHIPSMVLVVFGLLSITTAFNEGQQWGLSSLLFQLLLWGGVVLLLIFIWLQRVTKNPLINLQWLQNLSLRVGLLLRVLTQMGWVSLLFTLGLLLQNILNYSALTSSLILSSLTIAASIAAFTGGKFVDIYGSRYLIMISVALNLIACVWLAQSTVHTSMLGYIVPLVIMGVGLGLNAPSLIAAVLKNATAESKGTISGLSYASIFIGGGFATIISGWVLYVQSTINIQKLLAQSPNIINPDQATNLQSILTGANSIQHLTASVQQVWIQQAFVHAFSIIMWICAGVAMISLLLAVKIDKKRD